VFVRLWECRPGIGRALRRLLFEVQPNDLPTFVVAGLVMCVATVAAAYAPARRASRVDPIIAIK